MDNFITLIASLFVFFYLYIYTFKLNSYFYNAKGLFFNSICSFVFTFLLMTLLFVFIDVMTTSTDKNFLIFKENFAINFLFCFESVIMIILPSIYLYYLINNLPHEKENNFIISENKKNVFIYLVYMMILISLNLINIKIFPLLYNQFANNTGFSDKVPEGLATYAKIETTYQRIVYFNFGLLMMFGKFLGFTYMPYGMAKYVHDLIYFNEKNNFEITKDSHQNSEQNISEQNTKIIIQDKNEEFVKKENFIFMNYQSPIASKESSSDFFSNENKSKSNKTKSNDLEEKNTPSNNSNDSLLMNRYIHDEEEESFIQNENKQKNHNKIITVVEYFEKINQMENDKKYNLLLEKVNNLNKRKIDLNLLKPISNSIFNLFYYTYIIFSIGLIFSIIYTKITIVYIKLIYNICGVDCGLLAYRFDDVTSLETITNYLANFSQNLNSFLKFDFLFFSFVLLFRTLTIYKSFTIKGISFMWKIFYAPDQNMPHHHIIQIYWTILLTGIVLIYDFTYLFPDYIRFNGLDPVCDYTLINKSYCGVSFYGLLFIKISMNYHFFMYWDILASAVFITNAIIWSFRLIIKPLSSSLVDRLFFSKENWQTENEKTKLI